MAIPAGIDAKIKEAVLESRLQESVDEMLKMPQYEQYVKMAKLGLIDSKFQNMDDLLKLGYLKGYDPTFRGF